MSGYQDSNLGPPAPKAGALTGLRYIPNLYFINSVKELVQSYNIIFKPPNILVTFFIFYLTGANI